MRNKLHFSCLCLSRLCTFSTCTMHKRKRCSTDSEGLPLVRHCIQSPAAFSSYPSPETAEGHPSKRAKSEPKSVVSKARFTIYAWGAYQLTCSFRTLRSMPIALKIPPNWDEYLLLPPTSKPSVSPCPDPNHHLNLRRRQNHVVVKRQVPMVDCCRWETSFNTITSLLTTTWSWAKDITKIL